MSFRKPRVKVHAAVSLAFSHLGAVVATGIGATVLVGWITGIDSLTHFLHPAKIRMNPAPAVCFVMVGFALWFASDAYRGTARERARLILAALTTLVAALKLVDLLPGVEIPIDHLLFSKRAAGNEMSPNTALCFLLAGGALFTLERRHTDGPRLATTLTLFCLAFSTLALTGYVYDVQVLYRVREFKPMSPNTSIGMLMLSLGILCARPRRQPIITLIGATAGGVVARRLLPVAIVPPLVLGWLELRAVRMNLLENDVGVMLFALAIVAMFLTLIWWIARSLYRLDVQRELAEAAVADSNRLLRTLIDHLPDRIYAKDTESRFLINNEAHLKLLGAADQSHAVGKRDEDFVAPDMASRYHEEDLRIISTGEPMLDQEQRRTTPAGEARWVTATKVPFKNAAGHVAGIVGITHDITAMKHAQSLLSEQNAMLETSIRSEQEAHAALKRAQSQLVQNEKLASLGQMVAGVAHEINNPLSFVANNVAVLQRDLRALVDLLELYQRSDVTLAAQEATLAAEIRELADRIDLPYTLPNIQDLLSRSRDGLRRIQQIVKDLRDFARLDESDLHEVNLNDGIRSTSNIIQGLAKKQQVKIELDLGELPAVACFPAKINQVVMNLLSNAIQASKEGTVVTLRTRRVSESVTIEVIDHGSGMPAHVRDRIFDPFFTTKPPGEGTGLGLSISYGIVQNHNGRIGVATTEGEGTTFTVTLPIGKKK